MTSEEELAAAMTASTAVASEIGQRFWPDEAPKNAVMPCAVYARIDTEFTYTIESLRPKAEKVFFEVHVFARTRPDVERIATVISDSLGDAGFQATRRTSDKITELDEVIELSVVGLEYWHSFS